MNKKLFFIFAFLFLFSLTFISADKIIQTSNPAVGLIIETQSYDYVKIGQEFELHIHVFNATTGLPVDNSSVNCSFQGYYANGSHAVQTPMTFEPPYDFSYTLPGAFFTGGKGSYIIQCNNSEGGFRSSAIEVTLSGLPPHLEQLWAYLFLVLVMGGGMFYLSHLKNTTNFESLENKLYEKYRKKNHIRLAFSIIYTNMLKNIYVFQYLIGFLVIISLKEIIFLFNLIALYQIFIILMSLYAFGGIFVGASVFSNVQEWIMNWKEDLEKMNWGEKFGYGN